MKPLHLYIEYLLKTRHYAFVPGLGGFMYQEIASTVMRDGQIAPPFRLLKFNRFMDHDDGMLANVVMKAEGVTYDEATLAIRWDTSDISSSTTSATSPSSLPTRPRTTPSISASAASSHVVGKRWSANVQLPRHLARAMPTSNLPPRNPR